MTGELVIEVVVFDGDWQRISDAEANDAEAALVAARELIRDYHEARQSTVARCYVQFFVEGVMILAADDRAIRTQVGV